MSSATRSTSSTLPKHLIAEVSPQAPAKIHRPRVAKHVWRTKGEAFDPAKVTRNPA